MSSGDEDEYVRLFVGFFLPKEHVGVVEWLRGQSKGELEMEWVPNGSLHVTIAFVGDIPRAELGRVRERLLQVDARPVPLALSHLSHRSNHTLRLMCAPSRELLDLRIDVCRVLQMPMETSDRISRGHVTVGHLDPDEVAEEQVTKYLETHCGGVKEALHALGPARMCHVQEFHLIASVKEYSADGKTVVGSGYDSVAAFPLQQGNHSLLKSPMAWMGLIIFCFIWVIILVQPPEAHNAEGGLEGYNGELKVVGSIVNEKIREAFHNEL